MKRPKQSRRTEGTKRRSLLFIAGAVVIATTAIVLIVVLISKTPDSSKRRLETRTEEIRTNYAALRNEAIDVVRQLVADFPQDPFPLGLLGTVYNQFGNSSEAEKCWQKCLERYPGYVGVFEVLAVAFLRKGEFEKVVELSRRMLAITPTAPGVNRRLAEALLEMGELDEALVAIEREKMINPGSNEAHIVLGRIQLQRKKYQEAVVAYAEALELRPGDSRCYFGLATAFARLGQTDKSGEYSAKFAELRAAKDEASTSKRRATDVIAPAGPILAEALVDVGRTYQSHEQLEKAEAHWRRAAAVDPANTACRLQLVSLYRRTGRGQEAADICGQLTKIDPANATYHLTAGVVLAGLKRFDVAEQALRKSIELAPESANGYRSLAALLLRRNKNLPEARTLAQKTVDLAPTAPHYVLLSQACYKNQEPAAALVAIKRATELDPDNMQTRKIYEKLQQEQ